MREIRGKWSLSIANFIKFSLKTQGSNDYLKNASICIISKKSIVNCNTIRLFMVLFLF